MACLVLSDSSGTRLLPLMLGEVGFAVWGGDGGGFGGGFGGGEEEGGQTRWFGLGTPTLLTQLVVLGAECVRIFCQHAATLHSIVPISTNKRRAVQMSGRQRPVRDANDRAPTHKHKHTHTHKRTQNDKVSLENRCERLRSR